MIQESTEREQIFLNWSSGKDAAYSLYLLQQNLAYEVVHLLTTVNEDLDRVTMHGLRSELLEKQLQQIGLPYSLIKLPRDVQMEDYERLMQGQLIQLKGKGLQCAAFGDIFLEDLRKYREQKLESMGFRSLFPLWKKASKDLYTGMFSSGFKAIVVCVNNNVLDDSFCGRIYDQQFIEDLPEGVDPLGENGEFHTFCFDGPIFKSPVIFKKGELVHKSYPNPSKDAEEIRFCFCDLIPA
ncbi:MAG: adenine nucleotide alpha hydrolase [Bacteroidetes bacterium]|nr:MAG: adenine nucleotide alpha hydrolase [Bacteroidota bacterium]